jgi:hypothetical protein
LPVIPGGRVSVSVLPDLTAYRGKLLSQVEGRGTAVHAASFIRERRIVLETSLFNNEPLLRLILVHELFHFRWPRLGNHARACYTALLEEERAASARGELGESAEVRKRLAQSDRRRWKDYVCESFCDTAAWLYSGVEAHPSFRLAAHWRNRRADWFHSFVGTSKN